MSSTLPPRTNIFGESIMRPPNWVNRSINPFTVWRSPKSSDAMDNELFELGKGLSMPDKMAPNTDNVDMTSRQYGLKGDQTPYDRMMQIMNSKDEIFGQTLREQLQELMQSDTWKDLSPGVEGIDAGGIRLQAVNRILQTRRMAAFAQVVDEFPKLKAAYNESRVKKGIAHVEGKDNLQQKAEDLLQLFNDQ